MSVRKLLIYNTIFDRISFLRFGTRTRPDQSGREAFNTHVQWCFFIAVAVFLIVLLRTGMLQLTGLYKFKPHKIKRHFLRPQVSFPIRGEIYDRNRVLVATSLPLQTVAMDPFKVRTLCEKRRQKAFQILARAIGTSINTLEGLSNLRLSMVPVRRAVNPEVASRIREHIKRGALPGIELIDEQVREYPWGNCTRAILGAVRGSRDLLVEYKKANRNRSPVHLKECFPWYRYSSIAGATPQRGIGGVEQALNSELAGTSDLYMCHLDRNMNPIQRFTQKIEEGKKPCSVVLTIDIDLQRFVAQLIQKNVVEKNAQLGMAVVMDANAGEILAAYSASFEAGRINCDDARVFTSSFEPGSVLKLLVMLYAFELGVLSENDRFNCNRPTRVGNKTYKDERTYSHPLSPEEIIALSSDSGMAQIVSILIAHKGSGLLPDLDNFLQRCGLGGNIFLNHTAVLRSTLPSPDQWTAITPSQLAIGYEVTVSPFHLVRLYAAFANGGKMVRPMLVKRIIDARDGIGREPPQEAPFKACFSSPHASRIYRYLKAVVSNKKGTGQRAAIEGQDIAGKTGTARRLVDGKYSLKSHNSTFIGILPIEKDVAMIIGVFFQDIKKGSDYAAAACAPVFREIAQYILEGDIR